MDLTGWFVFDWLMADWWIDWFDEINYDNVFLTHGWEIERGPIAAYVVPSGCMVLFVARTVHVSDHSLWRYSSISPCDCGRTVVWACMLTMPSIATSPTNLTVIMKTNRHQNKRQMVSSGTSTTIFCHSASIASETASILKRKMVGFCITRSGCSAENLQQGPEQNGYGLSFVMT